MWSHFQSRVTKANSCRADRIEGGVACEMVITGKWIDDWAKKYDQNNQDEKKKEDDIFTSIKTIGSPPHCLTKEVLIKVADWKAPRAKGYVDKNDPYYVEEVTRVSFTTKNEKLKLEVLTLLDGVDIRMASTILHFCFPDLYSVMDWRAWESLRKLHKISGRIENAYGCYKRYNDVCQEIAEQFHVSLKILDKALWQWKGGV